MEQYQEEPERFVSVVQTSVQKEITKVVVQERKIIIEAPRQEIPQQPVRESDDDWFVLLDVVPREASYVLPGITKFPALIHSFMKASNYPELCRDFYF